MTEEISTLKKWKDAFILLRLPFSVFLMTIFWFAILPLHPDFFRALLVFFIIHFLLYPASNAYNSYYDRDEEAIGILKHPPKVNRQLWYLIVALDLFTIAVATTISFPFALMMFIFMIASKSYSYERTRLKKYPVAGTIIVIICQGFLMYLAVQIGIGGFDIFSDHNILLACASSLFLLGSYPITQIYQHEEDRQHGDKTISILLGINGTFLLSAIAFLTASALITIIFSEQGKISWVVTYWICLLPTLTYFAKWYAEFLNKKPVITFERTMKLNLLSSLSLTLAFLLMKFVLEE